MKLRKSVNHAKGHRDSQISSSCSLTQFQFAWTKISIGGLHVKYKTVRGMPSRVMMTLRQVTAEYENCIYYLYMLGTLCISPRTCKQKTWIHWNCWSNRVILDALMTWSDLFPIAIGSLQDTSSSIASVHKSCHWSICKRRFWILAAVMTDLLDCSRVSVSLKASLLSLRSSRRCPNFNSPVLERCECQALTKVQKDEMHPFHVYHSAWYAKSEDCGQNHE